MSETQHTKHLESVARSALERWRIQGDAGLRLISLSENAMFLVTVSDRKWVMRVHRLGYHTENGIRSELAWMRALRQQRGVETPKALSGLDGDLVQAIHTEPHTEPRFVVLFDYINGVHPEPENLHSAFQQLGVIAAKMHGHARSWRLPPNFERQRWDYAGAFGPKPNWGHWRDGFAPEVKGSEVIAAADALVRQRLGRFGQDPERFGLIHSDLRLANLFVEDGETKVLDFDDCGFGWYLYDVASSVTFMETRPDIDSIIEAWIAGYRQIGDLSGAEIGEIPTFIMFRRLILMGWQGSHRDTDLAREMGSEYSVGTVELAKKYLGRFTS